MNKEQCVGRSGKTYVGAGHSQTEALGPDRFLPQASTPDTLANPGRMASHQLAYPALGGNDWQHTVGSRIQGRDLRAATGSFKVSFSMAVSTTCSG